MALKWRREDLIRIAKRENNQKRRYLLVDPLQGKHIPADPGEVLGVFKGLAGLLEGAYGQERLLLVGFAETATAVGAAVAVELGAAYIQTTREEIPGVEFLSFSEDHSHATEQKLVKDDMDRIVRQTDRILFIEDEVTTGKTILHIIDVLEREYPGASRYAVASLINGMDAGALEVYRQRDIPLYYLVRADADKTAYIQAAESVLANGTYVPADLDRGCLAGLRKIKIAGWMDARRLVRAGAYQEACEGLCAGISRQVDLSRFETLLVIGTEEFMYPALYLAQRAAGMGVAVASHSTTRSPIAVSRERGYPLHVRYELRSLYDPRRVTFLYDIGTYDAVLILTDAQQESQEGVCSLVNAVCTENRGPVFLVRWCGA